MAKWLLLFILVIVCALAGGILLGPHLTPWVGNATVPPTGPTTPVSATPVRQDNRLQFIVVLVNDLDLGSKSYLELAWVSTMVNAGGEVQLALKPLPPELVAQTAHLPWIQDNGVINPDILNQIFSPDTAQNFQFLVLDLRALSRLWEVTSPLTLPAGGQCRADQCLTWVFQPDTDPTAYQARLHTLVTQSLRWIADQPQDRIPLVTQWLLQAISQGRVRTDIPPDIWSRWAAQAIQGGFQPVP